MRNKVAKLIRKYVESKLQLGTPRGEIGKDVGSASKNLVRNLKSIWANEIGKPKSAKERFKTRKRMQHSIRQFKKAQQEE